MPRSRRIVSKLDASDAILLAISDLRTAGLIVPSQQWALYPNILADKVPPEILRAIADQTPLTLTNLFTLRIGGKQCSQEVFVKEVADLVMVRVGMAGNFSAKIMSSNLAVLLGESCVATYAAFALYLKGLALADDHICEVNQNIFWVKSVARQGQSVH